MSVAILDSSGIIVAVNDTWKRFGRQNGLRIAHSATGSNYLQYCRSDEPRSRRFVRELKALLAGRLDLLTFIYPCHSPTKKRWFSLIGFPLSPDRRAAVALMHVNLTEILPFSISARQKGAVIHSTSNFDITGGVVERSVLEALSSQLNKMFMGRRQGSAREDDATHGVPLTKRQMQILRLLGEGKTNKEMAKTLFLSPNTVKLHVSAILRRLKLKSRTQAALISARFNSDTESPRSDVRTSELLTAPSRHRP
ncbi:MAG: response regulator transcription factor, partial [Gammaproteobacteria bacterium]